MALVATTCNTDLVPVLVSDSLCTFFSVTLPVSTAHGRNYFMNRFSKKNVSAEQCDMQFLKIDLEKKFLHIIECHGPLLFLSSVH